MEEVMVTDPPKMAANGDITMANQHSKMAADGRDHGDQIPPKMAADRRGNGGQPALQDGRQWKTLQWPSSTPRWLPMEGIMVGNQHSKMAADGGGHGD